jgi:hypothetical protein
MNNVAIEYYEETKNIWGLPQEYKGILLYPLKMKDAKYKKLFFELLTYPKNTIAEKQIIKMSYLKFLIYVMPQAFELKNLREGFIDFIKYVTKENDVSILEKQTKEVIDSYDSFEANLKIGENIFTEMDFDNIREIILEQNGLSIEYVDSYHPEFEKILIYTSKKNTLSEEDEITIFCVLSGKSLNEVVEYSIYQFQRHLERLLLLEDYRLYQPLLTSGQIELKKGKIEPYSIHISKKGRYDSILIDVDKFKDENKELISPENSKIRSK